MDFFDLLFQIGIITSVVVLYLLLFTKNVKNGRYSKRGRNYPLKYICARYAVYRWKSARRTSVLHEDPSPNHTEGWDGITLRAVGTDGCSVLVGVKKWPEHQSKAEIVVHVKLSDGTTYELPRHPDTLIGDWDCTEGWAAGGLKIEVLKPFHRHRVLFHGPLKRNDGVIHHVRFTFIWTCASEPVRHPDDWSSSLAAHALALEPWRDGAWPLMLDRWGDGSWHQWGVLQGRFEAFNGASTVASEWLQCRGTKERSWSPHAYHGLHRTVLLTLVARDGTMVKLRAVSYKDSLTQAVSGSVRYPNHYVESITGTDLSLPEFAENRQGLPLHFTLNVSSASGSVKLFVRPGAGGWLHSGAPYQHTLMFKNVGGSIDGEAAFGFLECGYVPLEVVNPTVPLYSVPQLRLLPPSEVSGTPPYCVWLEDKLAKSPSIVGGKGASLAVLTQTKTNHYKVPIGICLTTAALARHFELHPELQAAVDEIQRAAENYNEKVFREKCDRASQMITDSEITGDLAEDISKHLTELTRRAAEENKQKLLLFAVRSSAVGEDGEALSAAGQNKSVVGCSSEYCPRGITECWGSMFAYNSVQYRRLNGQGCACAGAVVVQQVVKPLTAGVVFTRHPDNGDQSRILITANYGLGETVVSGTVEPDTFIVHRDEKDQLSIAEVTIGTKTHRLKCTSSGEGPQLLEVKEELRSKPCMSDEEVLELAKIAVYQDTMWGAARDIEFVYARSGMHVVQARALTSLARWSPELLLHELDSPVMADDDLTTFANIGEVIPKPMTPLSRDLVLGPLSLGMEEVIPGRRTQYDTIVQTTHHRCTLDLYQSVYKTIPKEINVGVRMVEMALHGRKVADEQIYSVALKRNPPSFFGQILRMVNMVKALLLSKYYMRDTISTVRAMSVNHSCGEARRLLGAVRGAGAGALRRCVARHAATSSASSVSQIIAMSVLLEGANDFTTEHCTEIGVMLSAGDVVSAEVPAGLARLARLLAQSDKAEDFRRLPKKEAFAWLETNIPEVHKEVQKFLDEHGHRAIMEFDLATRPWALEPQQLMEVLQTMRTPAAASTAPTKTDDEIIASLTTPQKPITRKILRWLLPLCRNKVAERESTKAHLVLAIHKMRRQLLALAAILVRDWYIPHEDLIFYFTLDELQTFMENRDPVLLRKATLRRQMFPAWSRLRFEETATGWRRATAAAGAAAAAGGALRGTPVCGGEVIARVAVVTDLNEIESLQQGDVLVTMATDIGWSPYFPLLSGIVTELGGLISHGAVIARECGLPCIVGAAGATAFFKTGDLVRLDGNKGIIEKVQRTEENTN